MAKSDILTPDVLRQLLKYEPETGLLFWRERGHEWFAEGCRDIAWRASGWNAKWAGTVALRRNSTTGYGTGAVLGVSVQAHRIAWSIYHDVALSTFEQIDHINGDKHDNRIVNLRAVSRQTNLRNSKLYSSNKSGVPGVMWEESHKAWAVKINFNGKQRRVSRHKCFADAVEMRKRAEKQYGYHANHGRVSPVIGG